MNASSFLPWIMWAFSTFFFAYQFVMRVAPGLIMTDLMQKFQIDASAYGLFASLYYVGYAGMQIPVALLLDKYGPKKVISISAFLCALGTLALVCTDHWFIALASRFLIGAGSAAGFLGTSKIISLWFPEKQYTQMVGLTFTFGLLGAIYGGKPIGYLISIFNWESVILCVGFVGIFTAVVLFFILRNPLQDRVESQKETSVLKDLKNTLSDKRLMLIAFANLLMVGALEGFADVWGVSYLVAVKGIAKSDAALMTSTIFFGMVFGGPILAYCADKLKSNYTVTSACGFLMGLIFIALLTFCSILNNSTLTILFWITGILCCYQVLIFSMGVSLVPKSQASITVAFLNCINMLGGSFFHGVVGSLMDVFWTGNTENNLRIYSAETYTCALMVIPIAAILGGSMLIYVNYKKRSTDLVFQLEKS